MNIPALLSKEAQAFIKVHEQADVTDLVLQSPSTPAGLSIQELVQQIAARQTLKAKIPTWYQESRTLIPDAIALQQSSSERTALYKQKLVVGDLGIDLTGGLGVDSFFLSQKFKRFIYIELDPQRAAVAAHNFKVLGAHNIEVVSKDCAEFMAKLQVKADVIYLDPARRKDQKKVFQLSDCTPDLIALWPKIADKAQQIMIKLSPLMDLQLTIKEIPNVCAVHILSIDNDCKELLVQTAENPGSLTIHTYNATKHLTQEFSFSWDAQQSATLDFEGVQNFLYEPNASILKAGAFNLIPQAFGVKKLAANTHLYTSKELILDFPGRKFEVKWTSAYKRKELKKRLQNHQANITVRNFPHSVAQIRQQTGLKDGGKDYLFACRDLEGSPIIIGCEKI